jgi:septal ring factor EnvC (AmiA/AmiB activator)
MLQQYGKTLTGKDTNLMQFSDFLNVFEKKRKELYASIKEKEEELEAVDKVIQELQAEMYQDVDGLKRGVQVTVVVLAEADGPAEITLAYGL